MDKVLKPNSRGKMRNSNLELYRVVVMLLIVAHHYLVNSGLFDLVYSEPLRLNSVFLRLAGAWGKTGINCFVLITGYFMCTGSISLKKYMKLVLPFLLYKMILYPIFWTAGYGVPTPEKLIKLFLPVGGVYNNFLGCFFTFYLIIPFLNILIRGMNKKQHLLLTGLLLLVYTGMSATKYFKVTMNYLSWFCVLYLVSSYIRLYPCKQFASCRLWGVMTLVSLALGCGSILYRIYTGRAAECYFYLSDSQKPLALLTAVCSFLFFKNLKVPQSRFINMLGASTFGVLLIHANNSMMSAWLWNDLLKNASMFKSPLLPLHMLLSVLGVFIVCTVIDQVRIRCLETPFFRLWDRKYPVILEKGRALAMKIQRHHIEE